MQGHWRSLSVELDVADLAASLEFYVSALGFAVSIDRPERRFAALAREGVDLMLQSADGPGERVRTAPLVRPFGRGVVLVVPCRDVDALHGAFVATGRQPVRAIEERAYDIDVLRASGRWPEPGPRRIVVRQFVAADPDGYLVRCCTERAG